MRISDWSSDVFSSYLGEFPDELRNFAGIVRRCERQLKTTNLVKRMVKLRIPAFLEVSHSNLSGDEPAIVIARVEDHRDLIARDAAGKDHLGASFPVAAVSIHVVDDGICRCCLAQLGETLSIHKFVRSEEHTSKLK